MSDQSALPEYEYEREAAAKLAKWIGLALLAIFVAVACTSLFPLRLLDPDWQLRAIATLVSSSVFALIGFGFILIAPVIAPKVSGLRGLSRQVARLAVLIVAGFLLLIPLQLWAALTSLSRVQQLQAAQASRVSQKIDQLRTAVRAASDAQDLQRRLAEIQAPLLEPQELNLPIAVLRSQFLRNIETSQASLRQRQSGIPPERIWVSVAASIRVGISAVAYAIGFAAGAQRSNRDYTVLQAWGLFWKRRAEKQRLNRLKKPKKKITHDDYIDMITPKDDEGA